MSIIKEQLLEVFLHQKVLRFGEFTTKSGRKSPFFVNTGNICNGRALEKLSQVYAQGLHLHFGASFDNLFGPAYKGIVLCAATAISYARLYERDVSFTFNRKEVKDHGEGGELVGQSYDVPTRVIIVEDVLTAGTSIKESMHLLRKFPGAQVVGILVGFDRQEKAADGQLARISLEKNFGIPVKALVDLDETVNKLWNKEFLGKIWLNDQNKAAIERYQKQFGAPAST